MNGYPASSRPAAGPNDLIGSLQVASLLDICQFLLLNRKSGILTLFHRSGVSRLFFQSGDIINAVDERTGREGRDVALPLFRIREGGFRFRQEPVHERRLIEETTENLLLEAARKMDEIGEALPGAGEDPAASIEKELLDKQEKGGALRKLFSSLERELSQEEELPSPEGMLPRLEKEGADLLLLNGRPPLLLRGTRIVRVLRGEVREEDLERYRAAFPPSGEAAEEADRAVEVRGGPAAGYLLLRRRGRPPTLEELGLPAERVDSLLAAGGVLLLTAEPVSAGALLHGALLHHHARRRDLVVSLDGGSSTREHLLVSRPLPGGEEERKSLLRFLNALPGVRVSAPRIGSRKEGLLLLDLARSGHPVTLALPGRDGSGALRRAAPWLREDGSLGSLGTLLVGVISLRLKPAAEKGGVTAVASVAPWGEETSRALESEDYERLETVLSEAAGRAPATPPRRPPPSPARHAGSR